LPDFLNELSKNGTEIDYSIIFQLFSKVLNLTDTKFGFVVYTFGSYDDASGISFFDSSGVSEDDAEDVINKAVDLFQNESSVRLFSKGELKPFMKNPPKNILFFPVYRNLPALGNIIIIYYDEAEVFDEKSPQIKFLSEVFFLTSSVYENEFNKKRINYLTMNDYLTDMLSRNFFYEAIVSFIQQAFFVNSKFMVLIISINGLEYINNSLGIYVGDEIIKKFAERIKAALHDTSAVTGRLNETDYTVLAPIKPDDEHKVKEYCQLIIEQAKQFIEVNFEKLYISINVGASIFPDHGETVEELLKKASMATDFARNTGMNSYEIYDPSMESKSQEILFLNNNLPAALSTKQFELVYQAQKDIETGIIMGAEALIRWKHPTKGTIFPANFIKYAEDIGYAIQIDTQVLEIAYDQLIEWKKKGIDLEISINISPRHFKNGVVINTVNKVFSSGEISPSKIKIELLESSLFEDFNTTVKVINELKEIGVFIALDDFGAGYSSLEYVTNLPMDYLKIDKAFTMQLEQNPNNRIILKTIMALAKEMKIKTIAEGVETQMHYDFLKEIGCDIAQGYLINKPMPIHEFEMLLAKEQKTLRRKK
jgi:diguanylate cyclase (GGDEF)-like protein